jgi:hypothetical protein
VILFAYHLCYINLEINPEMNMEILVIGDMEETDWG